MSGRSLPTERGMGSFCSWHRPWVLATSESLSILANSGSFSDNHAFKAVDVFTQ